MLEEGRLSPAEEVEEREAEWEVGEWVREHGLEEVANDDLTHKQTQKIHIIAEGQ